MDSATLVDRDIQDGQRLLDGLAGEGVPIRAACWIKTTEDVAPSLFIATPLVDQKGPIQAYRDVLGVLRSLEGVSLSPSDIGLLSEKHPIVHDVHAVRPRYREGFLPANFGTFGGMAVDGVYVYPPSEAFPGFNQIKQRYPSAEVFIVNLPNEALGQNRVLHPKLVALTSKVNASEFEGKAPETLYFVGPRYSHDEKVNQLTFAFRPEGWNAMYDPKTKQWQRVIFEALNRPPFEPADFGPLLELKSLPAPVGA